MARQSFVSFPANYPGTYPAIPATLGPNAQLSRFEELTEGEGYNPTDTMVETLKGWRGRSRVVVATRTYSWSRYTRGAKAAAREAALWTAPDGSPLRIWCYLVPVSVAQAEGFRVPRASIYARPGQRNEGVENNARGNVNGRSVVAGSGRVEGAALTRGGTFQAGETVFYLMGPDSAAPESPEPTPTPAPLLDSNPVPSGLASLAREAVDNAQAAREQAAARVTPGWVEVFAAAPDAQAEREAARLAREERRAEREQAANARVRLARERREREAALANRSGARVPLLDSDPHGPRAPEGTDPSVTRFRLLDLS